MSSDDIDRQILIQQELEINDSTSYFMNINSSDSSFFYNALNNLLPSDFTILVITNQRFGDKEYLKLVMRALDMEIKNNIEGVKSKIGIKICNVNLPPTQHRVAQEMGQYFPMVSIYNNNANLKTATKSIVVKERRDYVKCLEAMLKDKRLKWAKAMLVLEDDVVPHIATRTWLQNMKLILYLIENYGRNQHVALVKLFEPDRHVISLA